MNLIMDMLIDLIRAMRHDGFMGDQSSAKSRELIDQYDRIFGQPFKPKATTDSKWDIRFLKRARLCAEDSKDPSTRCGCVLARNRWTVSDGFNGLPQGVEDKPERYADRAVKYKIILHAEENALAGSRGAQGCTAYCWPMPPCAHCAALLIQHGIVRVVSPALPAHLEERWGGDVQLASQMYVEAGVVWDTIDMGVS